MTNVEARVGLTIASALTLYAKTKLKVNRAYTPTNMLNAATKITGVTYKRGEYQKAANDIRNKVKELTC